MPASIAIALVALGLIPSLVWFLLFLRKDRHPEPAYLLTKTFLMGIIVSIPAVMLQWALRQCLPGEVFQLMPLQCSPLGFAAGSPAFFLWAAFVEEFLKYFAVWLIALRSPEFDEPIDAMIYMIAAGLGFAAIENILVLFRTIPDGTAAILIIWALRSVGATLLHGLSCAITGYFLSLSWFYHHHRTRLVVIGLAIATLFHFAFNVFLSVAGNQFAGLLSALGVLLIMLFLVMILFVKIQERRRGTIPALAPQPDIISA
ncbi:MAG TPA: PrsW family intramembrane metalloprotease [Candidatus Paceibacterota bacterium]|nr:PrsW family intramembrane metalloprotease [Candidatus Paceibacterota bacterium]